MIGVLWGKFRLLIRKPAPFLATTLICMAFAYMTGFSTSSKIEVPVYSSLPEEAVNKLVSELNQTDSYRFVIKDEGEVKNGVAEGEVEAGIMLMEDSYVLYQAGETQNFQLINQYVSQFYKRMIQEKEIISLANNKEDVKASLRDMNDNPSFHISLSSYQNEKEWVYDQRLQALFGFALFFSIFTVGYNVVEILREKQLGIWDRLILSPTSKTKMYIGNLLYSFLLGYFQIVALTQLNFCLKNRLNSLVQKGWALFLCIS